MRRNALERRIAALEAEIARLKRRQPIATHCPAWWEQVAGVFAGDAVAFDSAMRLGRAYRQSLRPKGKRAGPSAATM